MLFVCVCVSCCLSTVVLFEGLCIVGGCIVLFAGGCVVCGWVSCGLFVACVSFVCVYVVG